MKKIAIVILAIMITLSGQSALAATTNTISASIEETLSSGPDIYVSWGQDFDNKFFYEARLYAKYFISAQAPDFSGFNASRESNPAGFEPTIIAGYNFQLLDNYSIATYFRVERGYNMSSSFGDSIGDYIHSTDWAYFVGIKQYVKLSSAVTAYVDLYGGVVQSDVTGYFPAAGQTTPVSGSLTQDQVTAVIGFPFSLTDKLKLTPYLLFNFVGNNPDTLAAKAIDQGGIGLTHLSTSSQLVGLNYSYSF